VAILHLFQNSRKHITVLKNTAGGSVRYIIGVEQHRQSTSVTVEGHEITSEYSGFFGSMYGLKHCGRCRQGLAPDRCSLMEIVGGKNGHSYWCNR
jgi:hypothetical protein